MANLEEFRHLMGYICAKYEANQSNRHGTKEWTQQKLQTTCVTLAFDLQTWKWRATQQRMKQIGHIGTEA